MRGGGCGETDCSQSRVRTSPGLTLQRSLQPRCTLPPPPAPLQHPGLPASPPPFAGFEEGVRGVEVGACAEGSRAG